MYQSVGLDWVHPDDNDSIAAKTVSSEWWKVLSPRERDMLHLIDITRATAQGSSEELVDLRPAPQDIGGYACGWLPTEHQLCIDGTCVCVT